MLTTVPTLLDILNDTTNVVDDRFMDAILLTFRSITTTEVFFTDLISRFHCRLPDDATEDEEEFFAEFQVPQKQR
jgi:RasGEF N-terminal motif